MSNREARASPSSSKNKQQEAAALSEALALEDEKLNYTELGLRNVAALFICLSDDIKRQHKKAQKHSLHLLSVLITRQMERRRIEAWSHWRSAMMFYGSQKKNVKGKEVLQSGKKVRGVMGIGIHGCCGCCCY